MDDSFNIPVVFAHRGASKYAPENTLAAFKLAREQGAVAIELDVQLSSDQEVVVFHDSALKRITGESGKIRDLTAPELTSLNAGRYWEPEFQSERIPTLTDVFSSFKDFPLINIELKNLANPFDDLAFRTAELIVKYKMEEQVLVSSFNPYALMRFHQVCPEVSLGRLIHSPVSVAGLTLFKPRLKIYKSIHVSYRALNKNLITYLHSLNKLVFAYTLNEARDIISALNLGVDGFFTDDPTLALNILDQFFKEIPEKESRPRY